MDRSGRFLGPARRSLALSLALCGLGCAPQAVRMGTKPVVGASRTLGREQSNVWLPMDVLEAKDEPARRIAMIEHIRAEILARHSTIDMAEVDRVLAAMARIRREDFVAEPQRRNAYLPVSVDIGWGQTLSDSYIVAVMVAAARVRPGDVVLDVGTGSGYQAALLAELGARVTTVEIVPALARSARMTLDRQGYRAVDVVQGDGAAPLPGNPRFDAILVAAGATRVAPALLTALRPDGRLVVPVGPEQLTERLRLITADRNGSTTSCDLGLAAFVPLTGSVGAPVVPARRHAELPPCFGVPVT